MLLSELGLPQPWTDKPLIPTHSDNTNYRLLPLRFCLIKAAHPMQKEGIAIVGIGCRFPGGVNDAESFWKLLVEGREAVAEIPADRWNVAGPRLAKKTITQK